MKDSRLHSIVRSCVRLAALPGLAVLSHIGAVAAEPALVKRGEYLARAADCLACHTVAGGKPYAGGAALKTAFGNLYAPNITPDAKTGIGSWTQEEFARALREGARKDGLPLYPAMPYDSYTKMSDADIAALWAYMRTVAPVSRTGPSNAMRFPMNIRPGIAVWKAAYFKPGRWQDMPAKPADWNRGGYLVEALGHCGACHTPRNIAMATDERQRLAGARTENWYAPDITSGALDKIASRSVGELARYLKTGQGVGNVKAVGPMAEVIHDSLSGLTDADLTAMAVYLKDQPPNELGPSAAGKPVGIETMAAGRTVYEANCATCHGTDGRGLGGAIPSLAGDPGVAAREPTNVITAVLQGLPANGKWGAMPSFYGQLDDQQIADAANYVRHSWGNQGVLEASSATVASLRTLARAPAGGTQAALLCPVLPAAELQPAMKPGPALLQRSARDPALLARLVHDYTRARPRAGAGQVIEANTAAYCRALSDAGAAPERTGAAMVGYAQQVAQVLLADRPAKRAEPSGSAPR